MFEQTSKIVQKRIYDFIGTRFGQSIVVIGAFVIAWKFISIISAVVTSVTDGPFGGPNCVHCCKNNYADNLAGTSFEHRLCLEPIDVVYTWVNGDDDRLKAQLALYKPVDAAADANVTVEELLGALSANNTGGLNGTIFGDAKSPGETQDHDSQNRYRDNSELRYSLRSIAKFAPWVRHIYIVTNGQVPWWLNVNHPRLTVVPHHDIWVNQSHLPVFASPAIESHLHRIPGLANKFIYFNDDVMLGNEIWPDDFYTHANGQKIYLSWNVPQCSSGCPDTWVGDGYCDAACNITDCLFDGGDCLNATGDTRYNSWSGSRDSSWNNGYNTGQSASRYCASGCPNNWVGDKVCDRSCKNVECAFDGGDCGYELIAESIHAEVLDETTHNIELPYGCHAFYMNLSTLFSSRIIEASHSNPTFVRSAIVTQQIAAAPGPRIHLLTVLLYDDASISAPATPAPTTILDTNATESTDTASDAPVSVEFFIVGESEAGHTTNITFVVTRSQVLPNTTATTTKRNTAGVDPIEMFARLNRGETFPTATTPTPAAATTTSDQMVAEPVATSTTAPVSVDTQPTSTTIPPVASTADPTNVGVGGSAVPVDENATAAPLVSTPSTPSATAKKTKLKKKSNQATSTSAASTASGITAKAGGNRATRMAAAAAAAAVRQHGAASAASAHPVTSGARRLLTAMPTTNAFDWSTAFSSFRSALPKLSTNSDSIKKEATQSTMSLRHPHLVRGGLNGISLRHQPQRTADEELERRHQWERLQKYGRTLELDIKPDLPIPNDRIKEWRQRERQGLGKGVNAKSIGVIVEGIPDNDHMDDGITTMTTTTVQVKSYVDGWNRDDLQLAARIANTKAKELLSYQREWADDLLARAVELRQAQLLASGSHEPVWPWELLDDQQMKDDDIMETIAHAPTTKGWTMSPEIDWSMELGRAHDLLLADGTLHGSHDGLTELMDETDGVTPSVDMDQHNPQVWKHAIRSALDLQFPGHIQQREEFETTFEHKMEHVRKATGGNRRLLDLYGDSLRFVNQLFTKEFGRDSRKAPAHMPHMIDKNVMAELQSRWPEQYDATSSHRFRHSRDMQFAFAYFYYVMNAHQTFDEDQFFDESLDLDRDGYLDEKEIRYMALLLNHGRRVDEDDIIRLHNTLYNASVAIGQPGLVSLPALEHCKQIMEKLSKLVTSKKKYRHEQMGLDQVEFYMVGNNASVVQKRLDEIRAKGPKFVCLNDDMNKTHAPPPELLDALAEFYESYFPKASPFELPDGVANPPGLYIDELKEYYRPSTVTLIITQSPVVLVLVVVAFLLLCICILPKSNEGGGGSSSPSMSSPSSTSTAPTPSGGAVDHRRQMVMV